MAFSNSTSKRSLLASGVLAVVLAFSTVYLVHYYGETRPTIEQPEVGRIHAVTIHARTVYLTSSEYAVAFAGHAIAIVAIGVFVGLLFRSFRAKT